MSINLYKAIDNSPLILFRIFLGLLLAAESFGAILTGWVYSIFIEPQYHFPHIGFEWLSPIYGNTMYLYFCLMGILSVFITIGYKYKLSTFLFTLLWFGTYLMQKESYNNHYYLMILVCFIMIFLPANKYYSVDAKINPKIKSLTMPVWCSWVMILQMAIVYFFATIHKFYPDWLNGTFTEIMFSGKENYPIIGELLTKKWFHIFIAYMGITFDALIIPMLLYKPTRNLAFFGSLIFHLFNAVVLQIGIFPFFALSFAIFFYEPETIRRIFFKNRPTITSSENIYTSKNILFYILVPLFLLQILLPIRHHFIKGDVLWTEEGHRLSWRMMLRSRSGYANFMVVDKSNGSRIPYDIYDKLKDKQLRFVTAHADGMWQMAQQIKKEFNQKGIDVAVYVDAQISINNHPSKSFIDPTIDLASVKWDHFRHHPWIVLH